jgi:hypothetical protein
MINPKNKKPLWCVSGFLNRGKNRIIIFGTPNNETKERTEAKGKMRLTRPNCSALTVFGSRYTILK